MQSFQNHILITDDVFQCNYLIPKSMKSKFEKWQAEFGNGGHEDDHKEEMDKYLVNSDESVALIVAELQDLRKKLAPTKSLRKKAK